VNGRTTNDMEKVVSNNLMAMKDMECGRKIKG